MKMSVTDIFHQLSWVLRAAHIPGPCKHKTTGCLNHPKHDRPCLLRHKLLGCAYRAGTTTSSLRRECFREFCLMGCSRQLPDWHALAHVHRWVGGRTDGWMCGWMDSWMDGCMYARVYACMPCAPTVSQDLSSNHRPISHPHPPLDSTSTFGTLDLRSLLDSASGTLQNTQSLKTPKLRRRCAQEILS